MTISRRSLFGISIAALASISLGACVTQKDGSKTTLTLNVSKIKQYAIAGISAATIISGILEMTPALKNLSGPLKEISSQIETDLNAFLTAASDNLEIVYDNLNYKTKVDSILSNLDRLLIIAEVISDTITANIGENSEITNKVKSVIIALKTIVTIFNTLIDGFVITASSGSTGMTEAEALSVLNVK